MAGIGFDAWVLRGLLSSGRKIRFRDYTVGALRSLTSYPFPRIEIEADGVLVSGHSAIVGRSSLYGGFLRPTPRADLDRDELEVCILSGGAGSLARLLPAMWSAGHVGREGVTHRVVTRVTARADHPGVPVQLDGELAGQLPATFVLDDRTLQIAY